MTILVPVARGRLHERVLDEAVRLGEDRETPLYVVHFVENDATEADIQILRDKLRQRVVSADVEATVAVESITLTGLKEGDRIGHVLLNIAGDIDASHVVVGHSAKGLVEDIRHGSTALVLVDNADVPVTVVPDTGD